MVAPVAVRAGRARSLLRVAAFLAILAAASFLGLVLGLPPGPEAHAALALHLVPPAMVLAWVGWREQRVAAGSCRACGRRLTVDFGFCAACGADVI